MSRLRALLIGIDAYAPPVPPLTGCVNDIELIAQTLRGRVPADDLDLLVLTNGDATRQGVTEAIRQHLGSASPDDTALLYYSGHGSQQESPPELWVDEPDKRNETLVLADSRSPGGWDLADKELAALLDGVAGRARHLLVVLDCCHSGDGTRDVTSSVRVRLAPPDDRQRPWDSFVPELTETPAQPARQGAIRGTTAQWAGARPNHVLLAACRSAETAKEITIGGRSHGALSAALAQVLRQSGGEPTYREIHRFVTAGVLQRVAHQHPQLETRDASDLDRAFLGGAIPSRPRHLTLSHLPDGWCIDAGAVHGVPEPIGDDTTELAVYALDGQTDGAPLAMAEVTRVLPDRSLVTVTPELDTGFIYRAVIMTIPLPPVEVAVVGEAAGTASLREAAASADSTLIRLVDEAEGADLLVQARRDGFEITRPGVTRPLVPVVAGEGREDRTVVALQRVARWLRLSALTNPTSTLPPGSVSVVVASEAGQVAAGGRLEITYAAELAPTFTVTLANTTSTPLWCALLDLTETYGIFTDALPAGSVALGPGQTIQVQLSGQITDSQWRSGTVAVTDHLRVVTSTVEFDPRSLEQPELEVEAVAAAPLRAAGSPRSTLDRLLVKVATRRLEPAEPKEVVADWRVDDVWVITHRPHH